jgi:hypothetical protein
MGAVAIVPTERITSSILWLRSQKVMLDRDLAGLYGVETRVLVQAVQRNIERFPDDFMFRLTKEEAEHVNALRSQFVISNAGRGGTRYLPYAFTEQGVAMLSSVLRSERAVQVNIEIMRAFVRLRQLLRSNEELARRLEEFEERYDEQFEAVWEAIHELITPPARSKRPLGFAITMES